MADLSPGSVFAGYRIEGVAGRGGMGVVYRATDLALNRRVALKFIAPEMAGDAAFRRRFKAESQMAASLDHPNVVSIFHAGEHRGALYLAMRYVEGKDLSTEIKEKGQLEGHRAADIVGQIASALGAAHANGLVHRDVKPGNVLLTPEDHAYLSDFGLTKRTRPDSDETRTGHLVGTLNYVAPEQIRGEAVGPRADIYALGCVLFHLVTGRPPFPMDSDEAKLWAHVSEPPPPVSSVSSDADPAFDPVIERAMAKEPAERFGTADELADAARSASPGPRGSAPAIATRERTSVRPAASSARPLLLYSLVHPFNVAVLAGMVIAGLLVGALPLVMPAALLVYGAAVARTYFDADVRRKVLARTHTPDLGRPALGPKIAELRDQAVEKEERVRAVIDRAGLRSDEVAQEVDELLATMRRTADQAELLQEGLDEAPPEAIAGRLDQVRREGDPDKAKLIAALGEQLAAQNKMDGQLQRFVGQMEHTLVRLDTMRSQLLTASTTPENEDEEELAAEMRGLRDEMGNVADDMAAAYGEQPGSRLVLGSG